MIMMGLGPFRFGVTDSSFQEIQRQTAVRFPVAKPVGAGPLYQYNGPDEDILRISGVFYPEWFAGYDQFKAMRSAAVRGGANPLVSALGTYYGNWITNNVEEIGTLYNAGGVPRKVEFNVELANAGSMYGGGFGGLSVGLAGLDLSALGLSLSAGLSAGIDLSLGVDIGFGVDFEASAGFTIGPNGIEFSAELSASLYL